MAVLQCEGGFFVGEAEFFALGQSLTTSAVVMPGLTILIAASM